VASRLPYTGAAAECLQQNRRPCPVLLPSTHNFATRGAALSITRRQSLKAFATASIPSEAMAARVRPVFGIRLVVLDVGGTIVEEHGDVPQALMSALSHHGIESSAAEIQRRRGASKREIVRYFVEKQAPPGPSRDLLIAAIYDEFSSTLIDAYRSVPAIPGAESAIQQIRRDGYLIATTTGFDRAITTSIFQRFGWEKYFAATICSDDVAQGRPSPFMLFHAMEAARVDNVAEVMAVGDTPLDLQAGTNAGLRAVIGVLSGAATAETLRREPHTHILPSVASLPALLRSRV
jgi:phosphonatase-like hydrolase